MMILFASLSFLNGAILAIQQVLNAALGVRIGSLGSSFVNHLIGGIFAGLLLVIGFKTGNLHFGSVPFLYFCGGCFGVGVVAFGNYAVPHIGVALMVILLMSCQLIFSMFIDQFGWLGGAPLSLNVKDFLGVALLIVGALLVFAKGKSKASRPIS